MSALNVLQEPEQENDAHDHVEHDLDDLRDTGNLVHAPQDQAHDTQHDERYE